MADKLAKFQERSTPLLDSTLELVSTARSAEIQMVRGVGCDGRQAQRSAPGRTLAPPRARKGCAACGQSPRLLAMRQGKQRVAS